MKVFRVFFFIKTLWLRSLFTKTQLLINKVFTEGVCVPVDKNNSPSSYKEGFKISFTLEQTSESGPE